MLVNYSLDSIESENASNSVTLVPRLDYSVNLLTGIIEILQEKRIELKNLNEYLVTDFKENEKSHVQSVELEHLVVYSLEILLKIQNQIGSISGINSIPEILPSSIPMIRTISAKLFGLYPTCSQKLSELSVQLGSIVLDAATLTKARFDFSKSNHTSSMLLNEVKLMADSKLNKQYPLVDFFKDIERIRSLSTVIDKKLSEVKPSDEDKIDKLTLEELQDLEKIAGIADFMLTKYADKKEMCSILKNFTSVITETTDSMGDLDDELSELILSAEDSISKVKDLHAHIDDKSNFKKKYSDGPDYDQAQTSSINLTNFVTEINTVEYQQKSSGHNTR